MAYFLLVILHMTRILPGLNNAYHNLPSQNEAEAVADKKLKPLVSSLRNSDTSTFINSAYLIDLSEEAKSMSEYQQNKMRMNDIINNWRDIRYKLDEEI
jgi:hypothetical protein